MKLGLAINPLKKQNAERFDSVQRFIFHRNVVL